MPHDLQIGRQVSHNSEVVVAARLDLIDVLAAQICPLSQFRRD
jgi:hypothetical protein